MQIWINDKITQKKGEIKEDYKEKQKLIVHKVGMCFHTLTMDITFYELLRVILKSSKHSSGLPWWLALRAHSASMSPTPTDDHQPVIVIIFAPLMGKIL